MSVDCLCLHIIFRSNIEKTIERQIVCKITYIIIIDINHLQKLKRKFSDLVNCYRQCKNCLHLNILHYLDVNYTTHLLLRTNYWLRLQRHFYTERIFVCVNFSPVLCATINRYQLLIIPETFDRYSCNRNVWRKLIADKLHIVL